MKNEQHMKYLEIKENSNFRDIENFYEYINKNSNPNLYIPSRLTDMGIFGLEGLVLLLIATWMRNHVDENFLYSDLSSIGEFNELCDSLYGICAIRYAKKIVNPTGSEIQSVDALSRAYSHFIKVKNEDFLNAFGNGYLAIPSFRAEGKNSEFKSPFYNGETIVSEEQFQYLIKKALDAIFKQKEVQIDLDDDKKKNIAGVIRELFSNTHKHARTDEYGNILINNFRAVTLNYKKIDQQRLKYLIGAGGGALSNFGSNWIEKGNLSLLDITVVDSGPGYARRWINDSRDKQNDVFDERMAILECFTKHRGTGAKESSGSGLNNVLADLKKLKGWFMLRTGSTMVEKSFLYENDNPEILPVDVKRTNGKVEGTSFNIVIPLNDLEVN
jgi:hypothetical protein